MKGVGALIAIAVALALQTTVARFMVGGTAAIDLVLVVVIAAALWWALDAGEYDDLDRPAESILLDNDKP